MRDQILVPGKPRETSTAFPLVYNQSCEDPEVELAWLRPGPGQRIFTVASGGCNVLSLAQTGAAVTAVDRNPAQVALTEIKVEAARHLDHRRFVTIFRTGQDPQGLIDGLPMSPQTRRILSCRRWFDGPGLYQRSMVGRSSRLLRIWVGASGAAPHITTMFAASSLPDQQEAWRHAWHRLCSWPGRRLLATRWPLVGFGVPPGVAKAVPGGAMTIAENVGRVMMMVPAGENWFWQLMLTGSYQSALPPYLRAANRLVDRVDLRVADIGEALARAPRHHFHGAALLDTIHWVPTHHRGEVWASLHRALRPGARVTARWLDPGGEPPPSLFATVAVCDIDSTGCYPEVRAYARI